jgi:hypothetical protein
MFDIIMATVASVGTAAEGPRGCRAGTITSQASQEQRCFQGLLNLGSFLLL